MVEVATWIDKNFKRLGEELRVARDQIKGLQEEVSELRLGMIKRDELDLERSQLIRQQFRMHTDKLAELGENVRRLLLEVFPGAAIDVARARKFIGESGLWVENPLDKRKPSSED